MLTDHANGDTRLSSWSRVREYAVPTSMIETATARRHVGDWAGACAAAGFDVDLDLRAVAHAHGRAFASRVRSDLRHLAPDLLRWHMPRIAPDGLLRPGLTVPLARYDVPGRDGPRPVQLVVRTVPAWADAGQRMSLALWDGTRADDLVARHPHPRPSRRFRFDLHRHLWDARRTDELPLRSGAGLPSEGDVPPELRRCAVHRWAAEAGILLRADGHADGPVAVRVGSRRLVLETGASGPRISDGPPGGHGAPLPLLPDAATWVLPDLELIRAGAIEADRLHPLVAAALVPGWSTSDGPSRTTDRAGEPRIVECRGARHRIGLVDGVLSALDHDPAEIRREELLAALSGTPLPCLRAIDDAHRRPDSLTGVRERLDHGDIAGALSVVEGLLGPDATLRDGPLRDALEAAVERRVTYGLYRAGLVGPAPGPARLPRKRVGRRPAHPRGDRRTRPRNAAGA
ncbi:MULTISPECIES: hypothetical protein [Streptomyces]|uniref:Uncharacterized protein n=1 Tax=Streptomyces solicathayae TaxID=3081768 RepID=A0ABZ0M372_9ACTN|nr:hypothetical protein [Streptomyces sp. HUAS YS2]WOX26187.1 hypothetical protein R2D22_34315 [Streptomyces sp. HUAS YS2]